MKAQSHESKETPLHELESLDEAIDSFILIIRDHWAKLIEIGKIIVTDGSTSRHQRKMPGTYTQVPMPFVGGYNAGMVNVIVWL